MPLDLTTPELERIDAYWRAANYLTVGQIYLPGQPAAARAAAARAHQAAPARALGHVARAEPRLRAPEPAHPRARRRRDLPRRARARRARDRRERLPRGHVLGDLSRRVAQDADGHAPAVPAVLDARAASRATSSPPTPGSIHEGGELGYVLDARVRRRVRQPRPRRGRGGRRRRGGDRPARGLVEGHQLPQPGARRRGAADPAPQRLQDLPGPTVLGRATDDDDPQRCSRATATTSTSSRATSPLRVHQALARDARRRASTRIRDIQDARARHGGVTSARAGPLIVLRTPKGWTGPEGRRRRAGRGDVPRAPGAARRRADEPRAPRDARGVDEELPARASCSTTTGALDPELARARARRATGGWAPTRTPTAASCSKPLELPDYRDVRARRRDARRRAARVDAAARRDAARRLSRRTRRQLPALLPRRDQLEPARRRLRGREPLPRRAASSPSDDHVSPRRPRDGGAQRAQLPGLARGLPAHRPARPLRDLRGVRDDRRVDGDAARQVARGERGAAVARAGRRR